MDIWEPLMTSHTTLPTDDQLLVLDIELYCLICVYVMTLWFALANLYRFLIKQKWYTTWLVTFFYILSIMVLTTRIAQYCESIQFNAYLYNVTLDSPALSELVHYPRKISTCLTLADYSATSLGYVQLASLCELAIVMRFSIYHRRY